MRYEGYTYLWPPRPKKAIPENMLPLYERRGWVGQMKKNGTCTVVFVSPDGDITYKTRHNDDHKMWAPTERSQKVFENLPGDGWYVFVCEVLHNKTAIIKDTVYIFDILVADGELLTGTTFTQRMDTLKELFNIKENDNIVALADDSHYILNSNAWLAKTITGGFDQIMRDANNQRPAEGAPIDEGIVLKNPKATLDMPGKKTANQKWQVKCRIAHKNYDF
jgi:hypothetical protein